MKAQSQNEMKKSLTWWDLMWFGIGAIIGAGIFVLIGLETKKHVGPAVVLSYVVSGVSAMLSVFCYTEFAVEIPVAGGLFAYLRVELGDFVAFIVEGNILLECVIGSAAVARSWTSYFATLCNHHPNDFRIHVSSFPDDYNQLDPIAIVVIIVICTFAVARTKDSSRFNNIASIFHVAIIIFIVVVGLTKANPKNFTPFTPYGPRGIFVASTILFFIPIGLVGSMTITTLAYCILAVTLCLMQPYQQIDEYSPFLVAFEAGGWGWAKYIVAVGAIKGMTTVLMVSAIGQARYLTHIAKTHMISPWFAKVHERTGTPMNATATMLTATTIIAFFTSSGILSNLLSISILVIFMLVAVGLIIRHYYISGETTPTNRNKLIICLVLILGSSMATAIYWGSSDGWINLVVSNAIWFLSTLALWLDVPQAKKPRVWGKSLVPWLPSLSIAINLFLLGFIDKASFERFGIWTGILLVYYILLEITALYNSMIL
ncbi:cationic amino acid transporter 1-like, partial [Cucurbita pepo subsp. pepo]|uniref:cationic amino acid transporter 1-like n=1 Tax=Cucurbita pepo subsp. pepo TaxID=3664 RepID=UPI000C9D4D2F